MLGLRFCARAFSSCGKWGPLFIAVRRPLTVAASLVAEHRLQTRRLSNRGSRPQLLRGMWDLPRPGLEPVSPALAADSQPLRHQGSPLIISLIIHSLPSYFWDRVWDWAPRCPSRLTSLSLSTSLCLQTLWANSFNFSLICLFIMPFPVLTFIYSFPVLFFFLLMDF